MPFAGYENFDECLADNQDKDSPEGYCATIHYRATGRWPSETKKLVKALEVKFPGLEKYLKRR